jgi:hypothetical protein
MYLVIEHGPRCPSVPSLFTRGRGAECVFFLILCVDSEWVVRFYELYPIVCELGSVEICSLVFGIWSSVL